MDEIKIFREKCIKIRKSILNEIATVGSGHLGGCLSIVEVLVILYNKYMRIDPKNPKLASQDRLFLSKGHAGPALYAVLRDIGYFDESNLKTLNKFGTNFPSHPDMNKTPGVDMTTGSLGQGFSCAVGAALASKLICDDATIYAIIGDGECQEGEIWEAAMFASQQKLNNLIAIIDNNKLQLDGYTKNICDVEPICKKFKAFGWNTIEVQDGNNCAQVDLGLSKSLNFKMNSEKPTSIILNTTKGSGVSFVQNAGTLNHSMPITAEDLQNSLQELIEESRKIL